MELERGEWEDSGWMKAARFPLTHSPLLHLRTLIPPVDLLRQHRRVDFRRKLPVNAVVLVAHPRALGGHWSSVSGARFLPQVSLSLKDFGRGLREGLNRTSKIRNALAASSASARRNLVEVELS